jgi:hypothetical protein
MDNKLLLRVILISVHIFLNFILISYLMSFDVTGSWVKFSLFILLVISLLILFIKHLISFILFLKSKS